MAEPLNSPSEAQDTATENPFAAPQALSAESSRPDRQQDVDEVGGTMFLNPWRWVPSLYFAEAVPFVLVQTVSVIYYNRMGLSNVEMGIFTSLLYWPWVIKPLWSPVVDVVGTKRAWILSMQLAIALGIGGIALGSLTSNFFLFTICCFTLVAFASATHDIAADGFYLIGMDSNRQAWFVGIRSTFYRLGILATGGILVTLVGTLMERQWSTPAAWSAAFAATAIIFVGIALYHAWQIPRYEHRSGTMSWGNLGREGIDAFASFFGKRHILIALAYILLYRFAEGQITKMLQPFLLDPREEGGLAISVKNVGVLYGTIGVIALVVGGILGGIAVSRHGLGRWFLWMAAAINVPNLGYLILAATQPENIAWVGLAIAFEQFGYGFGFAGYMLFLLWFSKGSHETAHYAFCTGLMALGMMLPGFISGPMQEYLGYRDFFVWVMFATIPSFLVAWLVPIDPNYGLERLDAGSTAQETSD